MHRSAAIPATALALILAGCGSKAEAPVEQIVVRQPGHAAASAPTAAAPAAGDLVAAGKAAFAVCAACHSVEPGGASGIGPNLHGVVGRRAGSAPGYAYSEAMKRSGIVWDAQTLDAFLASPQKQVPGSRMRNTTSDPQRRRAVIEYLSQH